jgi:hypothetical protein
MVYYTVGKGRNSTLRFVEVRRTMLNGMFSGEKGRRFLALSKKPGATHPLRLYWLWFFHTS